MKIAHGAEKGAIGLEGEMIDAPMIKQVLEIWVVKWEHETNSTQAEKVIQVAEAAGLLIPQL